MARPGGAWVPDGRAKAIAADCEASLAALDGLPIDLYLVHAPDPRTPWKTSVRALARLADEGLVRRIGIANVNRHQLDEALELAPVAAVQVALSPFDDRALRGGIVERCDELGIALIAHSPLGGPKRAARVERGGDARVAARPLARRRPDPGRSPSGDRALGGAGRGGGSAPAPFRRQRAAASPEGDGEVVLVIGIPGAGKSRVAVGVHGARLPPAEPRRARRIAARAHRGARRGSWPQARASVVLDNTYLTRAARNDVIEVAARHGIPTPVRLAGHAARAGPAQPRRTPAGTTRLAADAGAAARAGADRARRARADVPDAHAPGAGAAVSGRGLRSRRARAVRARRLGARTGRRPRRGRRPRGAGLGGRSRTGRPGGTASGLRLESGRRRDGARRRSGTTRRVGLRACPGRAVPAPGRPARLLVPAAAAGPGARVRARARDRPVALDRDRRRSRRTGRSRRRSARAT